MILTLDRWSDIRRSFSDNEKAQIRHVITGEALCPRGWAVDETRLDAGLREKLRQAVRSKVKGKATGA